MGKKLCVCLALFVVFVVFGAVAVGCGGETTTTTGGATTTVTGATTTAATGETTTTAAGGADIAHVTAEIEKYSAQPVYKDPGPAFDAKTLMAGKKALTIPASSAIPFPQQIAEKMVELFKEVGMTGSQVWTNQGQSAEWVQGMEFGVGQKFTMIDLIAGIEGRLLQPQVEAAIAAGVLVNTTHLVDMDQESPIVSSDMPARYAVNGRLIADWVIMQTGGNVNALIITTNQVISTVNYLAAMQDEFAKYGGPNVKLKLFDVTIPDWATKIQTNVQSALIADPTINYIIPLYDSMSPFVIAGIETAGATDKVKIVSYNGTPHIIDLVREGKVEMDVGENLDWIAYAAMDHNMRVIAGLPEVKDEHMPLYIFTKDNAADAGVPAQFSTGYGGTEYRDKYRALWGLQ